MRLHVACAPRPICFRAAERGPKPEIWMFTRKRLKFAAIVKAAFETNSEEQREIFGLGIFQVLANHRTERRDARAGGNEQRVLRGISNHEETKRRTSVHRITRLQSKKVRRQNTFLDEIQA